MAIFLAYIRQNALSGKISAVSLCATLTHHVWRRFAVIPLAIILFANLGFTREPAHQSELTAAPALGASVHRQPGLELKKPTYPELESALSDFLDTYNDKDVKEAEKFANIHCIDYLKGRVLVEVALRPGHTTDEITDSDLAKFDIEVRSRSKYFLLLWVPVEQLSPLGRSLLDVAYMLKRPTRLFPDEISEGVNLIGARPFTDAGYDGGGIRIGIIDIGFRGMQAAINANELPADLNVRNFTNTPLDSQGVSEHGTACAEIIFDLASEAEFYFVKIDCLAADMPPATDYLIDSGVHIISMSLGCIEAMTDYFQGGDPLCQKVSEAFDNGIFWVNAAGNHSRRHYRAVFNDGGNADGCHRFPGNNTALEFNHNFNPQDELWVSLAWDDFPNSNNDYDLRLARWNGANWIPAEPDSVCLSNHEQNGDDPPVERIAVMGLVGAHWGVMVIDSSGNNFDFTLFSNFEFINNTPAGSLIIPAIGINAFAVGAINWQIWNNVNVAVEAFSSRGPRYDGHIKPEICGPDGVTSFAYGGQFFGTSAACPHVAGAAALIKSVYPNANNRFLWDYLKEHALDAGAAGQDNIFGFGKVNIGVLPDNTLDFGRITGHNSAATSIWIDNTGDDILHYSATAGDGEQWGGFAIGGQDGERTVFPGWSSEILVQFNAEMAFPGECPGWLTINFSDTNLAVRTIALSATQFDPDGETQSQIAFDQQSPIDFGEVAIGQSLDTLLRVRNVGDSTLAVYRWALSGGENVGLGGSQYLYNGAFIIEDFSCEMTRMFTLEPGDSADIRITFNARAPGGNKLGWLVISSSTGQFGQQNFFTLRGTAAGEADIEVDPASLDFGELMFGQEGELTVTVTNAGFDSTLHISSTTLVGNDADDFSIVSGGGAFDLAGGHWQWVGREFIFVPGQSREIVIRFNPQSVGEKSAALRVISNDPDENPLDVPLIGVAVEEQQASDIRVEPQNLQFNAVDIGQSRDLTISVFNDGAGLLQVGAVTLFGYNTDNFTIVSGDGEFDLEQGASRDICVRFSPRLPAGQKSAYLRIQNNDPDEGVLPVPLLGIARAVPDIVAIPDQLDFGIVPVGENRELRATIRNEGTAPLILTGGTIISAGILGWNNFAIIEGGEECILPPDSSHTIVVRYTPQFPVGNHAAILRIVNNDPDENPLNVQLTATARGSRLLMDESPLYFPETPIGESKDTTRLIYSDGNGDAMTFTAIFSGGNEDNFHFPEDRNEWTIEPGDSIFLPFEFRPLPPPGDKETILRIDTEDALNRYLELQLFGRAVGYPDISVTRTYYHPDYQRVITEEIEQYYFSTAVEYGGYIEEDIDVRNIGNDTLRVSSINITDDAKQAFSVVSGGGSFDLAPGASRELVIRFWPRQPPRYYFEDNNHCANLVIASNDPDENPKTIQLSGVGCCGFGRYLPVNVDFGERRIGQSVDSTIRIENRGNDTLIWRAWLLGEVESNYALIGAGDPGFVLPDETDEFTVRFSPRAPSGVKLDTIIIDSNDPVTPRFPIPLRGFALSQWRILVSPDSMDFGELRIGETRELILTLTNQEDHEFCWRAFILGEDETNFAIPDGQERGTLQSGAVFEMPVIFRPIETPGLKESSIFFYEWDFDGDEAIEEGPIIIVRGEALPPLLELQITWPEEYGYPDVLDWNRRYEEVFVGQTYPMSVTLRNQSEEEMRIIRLETDHEWFAWQDIELPFIGEGGQGMLMEIRATPRTCEVVIGNATCAVTMGEGEYIDTLRIEIPLRIEATEPPIIEVVPTEIVQMQLVGQSTVDTVRLTNRGGSALRWTSERDTTEGDPGDWLTWEPREGRIPTDSFFDIFITLDADSLTPREYRSGIIFRSNDPQRPEETVRVGMTVVRGFPVLHVEPTDITVDVPEGHSRDIGFTVSNIGQAPLIWSSALQSGIPDNILWFPRSGTIEPGGWARVSVTLNATNLDPGSYAFRIEITSNDPDHPRETVFIRLLVLYGPYVVTDPPAHPMEGAPGEIHFPVAFVRIGYICIPFIIRNPGDTPLRLDSTECDNPADFGTGNVPADPFGPGGDDDGGGGGDDDDGDDDIDSCKYAILNLIFHPSDIGRRTGTIRIFTNANNIDRGGENAGVIWFNLVGVGIEPPRVETDPPEGDILFRSLPNDELDEASLVIRNQAGDGAAGLIWKINEQNEGYREQGNRLNVRQLDNKAERFAVGLTRDRRGEPDNAGYSWRDSEEADGPTFRWIEIRGREGCIQLPAGINRNVGPYDLGFEFPWYAQNYGQIRCCSNGWLTLTDYDSADVELPNTPHPAEPNAVLAVLNCPLDLEWPGRTWYYWTNGQDSAVVTWEYTGGCWDRDHRCADLEWTPFRASFQAILESNGRVLYQYKPHLDEQPPADYLVGYESGSGWQGAAIIPRGEGRVFYGLAIAIGPADVWDIPWLAVEPQQGLIEPGQERSVNILIEPAGLAEGTWSGLLTLTLNDPNIPLVRFPVTLTISSQPERHWNCDETDANHSLLITTLLIQEQNAATDDEVGVFTPAGLLAGCGAWVEGNPLGIAVWGDDNETELIDGFRNNEQLNFRVWDHRAERVYPATPHFIEGPRVYQTNALSVLTLETLCLQHFVEDDPQTELIDGWVQTDQNLSLMITEVTFDEQPAPTGFEVGVFTPAGRIAAGGLWIDGEILGIAVWGDDPETEFVEGFRANERMHFRIWDNLSDREYRARANMLEGQDIWVANGFSIATLADYRLKDLTVRFVQNWNLISINVIPDRGLWRRDEGPDIRLMTDRLRYNPADPQSRHHILLMKDERGRFYSPAQNFSNIPYWNLAEGYQVKLDQAIQTQWNGEPIPADADVPINLGWNMIAYFPEYELSAAAPQLYVISPIRNNVIIAKDYRGFFLVPRLNFSNMSPWRETQGYQVKVDANVVLNYPAQQAQALGCASFESAATGMWQTPTSTSANMSVLVTSLSGQSWQDGDQVAAFGASGRMTGVGFVENGKVGLAVWGDDPSTNEIDGLLNGEQFSLKIWIKESDKVVPLLARSFKVGGSLTYETDGFVVVEAALGSMDYYFGSNYPNPFNSSATLFYGFPERARVSICIYDITGRMVAVLVDDEQDAGHYQVKYNLPELSTGVYLVRMEAGNFSAVRKVTLLK